MFVRGYQLSLNAGVVEVNDNRELRVQLVVENLNRMPHSKLRFSMLYAIASPSVSDSFSPWNHCTFLVKSLEKNAWCLISYIAEHSLIHDTGFYLKCYIE